MILQNGMQINGPGNGAFSSGYNFGSGFSTTDSLKDRSSYNIINDYTGTINLHNILLVVVAMLILLEVTSL